jgi:signal transduction histidine kinase
MPVMHRIGSTHSAALLLGLAVLAGACLIARWLWSSRVEPAKDQRGRLRELGWCAALFVLAVMVMSTLHVLLARNWFFARNNLSWWIAIPIAAAIIIVLWPRLAARILPVGLILYGLFGFVVARDWPGGGRAQSYGVIPLGGLGLRADLILPQAYALLLLGGWLWLRSADPVLARARLWLGPIGRAPLGDQVRTLALLPVVAVLAGLLGPRLWLAGGFALILTVLLLWGVVLLIRRWPKRATQATTAGLLCLGIAGLVIVALWHYDSPAGVAPSNIVAAPAFVTPQPSQPALAPSLAKSAPGLSAAPESASASPAPKRTPFKPRAFRLPALKSAALQGARVPASGADVEDVIWGRSVPYGAVLVDSQNAVDAAGVQGLALLALGAWLAPQTFPLVRRMLGGSPDPELTRRVERLTQSRAVAVDTASADLRRLERDLHDGAQARLVALGMSLRAAERLIPTSPDAAVALVAEAREASVKALTELRELVRGVLPPVLADRGLADAVRALALDSPLHVQTDIDLPGRLPAPVETACYFAVAELLTNAVKHSGARDARIAMSHSGRLLRIEVTDFGLGGADPARGSGLAGVERRLATFDGILAVSSPAGGPTMVVMEVPCPLSPPKTASS